MKPASGAGTSPAKGKKQEGRMGLSAAWGVASAAVAFLAVAFNGNINFSCYPPRSFPASRPTPEALAEAPGRFIKLSRGHVHYTIHTPAAGIPRNTSEPPVVLIHGFSMGSHIWEEVSRLLSTDGNRVVLTFDLYGRGFSDAAFPNDLQLFTGQLSELLFSLQPELGPGPYDIAAISMGGAIAVGFAATYPRHVRHLVLVAPAGFPVHVPLIAKVAKSPLVGDMFMPVLGPASLKAHAGNGHAHPEDPEVQALMADSQLELNKQMGRNKGFFPSLLSTIRDFPLGEMKWAYEAVAATRGVNSTLVIWGDSDRVTPTENAKFVMDIMGEKAHLVMLEDCGHVDMLAVERNRRVFMPIVIDYLR